MAAITSDQIALAIRATTSTPIAGALLADMDRLRLYASEAVSRYAGANVPEAVSNAAIVQICQYLYDAPVAVNRSPADVLSRSGARSMLAPYRAHRLGLDVAGAIEGGAGAGAGGVDRAAVVAIINELVDTWALIANAGTAIPSGKLANAPSGGLNARQILALISDWAEQGDTTPIPASKLSLAPSSSGGGLSRTQVLGLVYDWAEQGNVTPIPASKLTLAPSSGMGGGLNTAQVTSLIESNPKIVELEEFEDALRTSANIVQEHIVTVAISKAAYLMSGNPVWPTDNDDREIIATFRDNTQSNNETFTFDLSQLYAKSAVSESTQLSSANALVTTVDGDNYYFARGNSPANAILFSADNVGAYRITINDREIDLATWARKSDSSIIPGSKLPPPLVPPPVIQPAVWAREGNNDQIPGSKLANAPGGSGGGSVDLRDFRFQTDTDIKDGKLAIGALQETTAGKYAIMYTQSRDDARRELWADQNAPRVWPNSFPADYTKGRGYKITIKSGNPVTRTTIGYITLAELMALPKDGGNDGLNLGATTLPGAALNDDNSISFNINQAIFRFGRANINRLKRNGTRSRVVTPIGCVIVQQESNRGTFSFDIQLDEIDLENFARRSSDAKIPLAKVDDSVLITPASFQRQFTDEQREVFNAFGGTDVWGGDSAPTLRINNSIVSVKPTSVSGNFTESYKNPSSTSTPVAYTVVRVPASRASLVAKGFFRLQGTSLLVNSITDRSSTNTVSDSWTKLADSDSSNDYYAVGPFFMPGDETLRIQVFSPFDIDYERIANLERAAKWARDGDTDPIPRNKLPAFNRLVTERVDTTQGLAVAAFNASVRRADGNGPIYFVPTWTLTNSDHGLLLVSVQWKIASDSTTRGALGDDVTGERNIAFHELLSSDVNYASNATNGILVDSVDLHTVTGGSRGAKQGVVSLYISKNSLNQVGYYIVYTPGTGALGTGNVNVQATVEAYSIPAGSPAPSVSGAETVTLLWSDRGGNTIGGGAIVGRNGIAMNAAAAAALLDPNIKKFRVQVTFLARDTPFTNNEVAATFDVYRNYETAFDTNGGVYVQDANQRGISTPLVFAGVNGKATAFTFWATSSTTSFVRQDRLDGGRSTSTSASNRYDIGRLSLYSVT